MDIYYDSYQKNRYCEANAAMQTIEQKLARVDINLLVVFQVLMQERSVTKAAEHLFISQPAMSAKLQHLRELFEDPLFTRTHEGLLPTSKATQLLSPVSIILAQLSALIVQAPFTPEQAAGTISIQIPDSFSIALIPALYRRLQKMAPRVKLTSDNPTDQHLELLASGKADFSIYVADDYGQDFLTFPLGGSASVCWMRSGHPLAAEEVVSIDVVRNYPLAELTFHKPFPKAHAPTQATKMLQELHETYQLNTLARVGSTQLLTLLSIMVKTDTLLLGATYLSKVIWQKDAVTYRPVAEYENLRIPIVLIQHRRTEGSSMHIWLREQIIECWAEMETWM